MTRPLEGRIVVDVSRMLPGAVLARMLLDLGARLIKVEEPGRGDLMRAVPPLVEGTGAGFAALLAGAESVCLDLRAAEGAEALRALARRADVLVESFRPGTMERWGLGYEALVGGNPGLVQCSLSSFGSRDPGAERVGHDLNFAAESGLLAQLPGEGMPSVQLVDVGSALLACSAVLGALLARERDGRGRLVEQPLSAAPLPFLAWIRADLAAGGGEARERMLSGGTACYRLYRCGDGERVALGALEPKFWRAFVEAVGLPELAGDGLDAGPRGDRAAAAVAARLAERPSEHWLELAGERGIPLSPVRSAAEAARDPSSGETCSFLPGFPSPGGRAPRCGEHTERVLRELRG